MNPTPDPLDRLVKSAGRCRDREVTPMSFRTGAHILARWRSLSAQPPWFECVPLLRRGLAVACAAGVLLAALSFSRIKPATPDAWAMANRMTNTPYLP